MIADFGCSEIYDPKKKLTNTVGTYHFMPPESFSEDEKSPGFDGKIADIWSVGVTLYCMAF